MTGGVLETIIEMYRAFGNVVLPTGRWREKPVLRAVEVAKGCFADVECLRILPNRQLVSLLWT